MIVGIVGLGLIGGSLARAYKQKNHTVYGFDLDDKILDVARMVNVIDEVLDRDTIAKCDCILIALYPKATIKYLEEMAPFIDSHTVVLDCCGVKEEVCDAGFRIAREHGFTFVGGHPMAGKQYPDTVMRAFSLPHSPKQETTRALWRQGVASYMS